MTTSRSSGPPLGSSPRPSPILVAFAVLGAPAAWGAHLGLSYYAVPRACATGTTLWLHVITVATAAVAVGAMLAAGRLRAGPGGRDEVRRSLGTVGLLLGALFLGATLVEGIPVLLVDPCR